MRVILDTNVLLAALISRHRRHDIIYRAWNVGRFDLVTGGTQLDKLRRVNRYPRIKAILPARRVSTIINNMQRAIVLGVPAPLPEGIQINGPSDAFLLTMALAGDADYLVTGDRRAGLLQHGSIGRTRIVTPATFCSEAL